MAKVCFVRLGATPLFHESQETFGGAEVRAYQFATGLSESSDHDVSFALRTAVGLPGYSSSGNIRLHGLPRRLPAWSKVYSSLMRRMSDSPPIYRPMAKIDADVFACFGVHPPTPGIVAAAKRSGRRSLLFLASADAIRNPESLTANEMRHRPLYEAAIRSADVIVAQTEFQRQQILSRYGRPSALIRNPIEIPPESDRGGKREHVLWIGRADRDSKRADLCIELARRCPCVPFVLVMNETCPEVFRELTSDLPTNVTLLPRVAWPESQQLFRTATVLVNTSESEGFPNTFLQAASHGVPIVSRGVDPDGMLSKHRCGVVAGSMDRMCELTAAVHHGELTFLTQDMCDYVTRYHELSGRVRELDRLICSLVGSKLAA